MPKLTPGSWAKKLRAYAKDIPRQQNEIKKKVAFEIVVKLVELTPKDTGFASSSYFLSVGSPDKASVAVTFDKSGDASLSRVVGFLKSVKPGDTVFITNNVPYMKYLNAGWSPQAPAGFVEIAIRYGKELIQRQRIRYGV